MHFDWRHLRHAQQLKCVKIRLHDTAVFDRNFLQQRIGKSIENPALRDVHCGSWVDNTTADIADRPHFVNLQRAVLKPAPLPGTIACSLSRSFSLSLRVGAERPEGLVMPAENKPHRASSAVAHLDELLDEALEETFPASDAVAIDIERESHEREIRVLDSRTPLAGNLKAGQRTTQKH